MRCAAVALVLVLSSCGSDKAPTADAAAAKDATSAVDGARAGDGPAGAAPRNCQEIRNCQVACKADKACADRCVSSAPAAARTAYDKVNVCSKKECPTGDESCRCGAECFVPGPCTDLVDDCDQGYSDDFCQETCH